MNSLMWTHPSTQESLEKLEKWGWIVVGPATKKLACNDTGKGALEEINSIVQVVHGGLEARLELINDKDDREEFNIIDDIFIKKRQRKWVFLDQDSKESSYWVLATATALFVLTASVVMGMKVMNRTKY